MEKDKSEFIDAEDTTYFGDKSLGFSHEALVMESMRRAAEAGSHEMRTGWWNEKQDQMGNIVRSYIEDTREKFIETIQTLEMVMASDLDDEVIQKIKEIKVNLRKWKKHLLNEQWKWYCSLGPLPKQQIFNKYGNIIPEHFHTELQWHQESLNREVRAYRQIFAELTKLTKRLGYYKQTQREE
jgi:hypothetical protein